ncbi:uncharacterized protein K460DRAFT_430723 [Cucurbitaria berberidis CBS 394.84]|uniref:Uncharacterized protein n=1 Tax=Cucurbitaria berberidis CBS 394.84 TaxID=1168544 RepID=A0A9P4GHM7_9PLEO|nr:uncharacterized protein K460DRAFT_430723 [Cucurbitaria berberidis CBS 394.84]KAF1845807.1 hypothetical protein K460DRAFT_430723 [Cucurbitaria berberidis CBS 394.84]
MAIHTSRSRVKFLHTKQGGKKEKQLVDVAKRKQVKVAADNTAEGTEGLRKSTKASERVKAFPVFAENDSDTTIEEVTEDVPPFSKQRIPSTDEIACSSPFKSELRAAITGSYVSAVEDNATSPPHPPIEQDATDSPTDSLVMQAPLFEPTEQELQSESQVQAPQPIARERSSPSPSILQKIFNLFTGRKKAPEAQEYKKHSKPNPTFRCTAQEPVLEPDERKTTPEESRPPPRLTHAQTIPPVRVPGIEHLSHRPGYTEVLPAPEHRYTGFAAVAQDTFKPTVVQRGFEVGHGSPPQPLQNRRNNSAGNLLDRNGDTWSNWHSKNPSPEKSPFARTH